MRILLIDDEIDVLNVHLHMLQRFNHQVYTATSQMEALKLLESQQDSIDMIVTDYRMPGMPGIKFIMGMYNRTSIPVIVITGYADDSGLKQLPDDIHILRKPVRINQLQELIEQSKRAPADRE